MHINNLPELPTNLIVFVGIKDDTNVHPTYQIHYLRLFCLWNTILHRFKVKQANLDTVKIIINTKTYLITQKTIFSCRGVVIVPCTKTVMRLTGSSGNTKSFLL